MRRSNATSTVVVVSSRDDTPLRSVRRRDWLVDVTVVLILFVAGQLEVWMSVDSAIDAGGTTIGSAIAAGLGAMSMLVRRRRPVLAMTGVMGSTLLMVVGISDVLFWGGFWVFLVAWYSAARHGGDRRATLLTAYGLALLTLEFTVEEMHSVGQIVFQWSAFAVASVMGSTVQRLALAEARSSSRADELAATQELRERAVVAAERERIARELHDIVAHAVSVMVVQADAAEHVVADDPEVVRTALRSIQSQGRAAMTEMRAMVGVLRSSARDQRDPVECLPQPGFGELHTLVEEIRTTGVVVELETSRLERPVPAGLELAAYRIVQEALTNVRRHARASTARVQVDVHDDHIALQVVDDGVGTSSERTTSRGHGLVGMRERASMYGGTFDAGSRTDASGYRVAATLPIRARP